MLDKFTSDQLETLKMVLAFIGTIASLVFGIIGTTFETHKETTISKKGVEIKKRLPTFWLWTALIGLVISSTISASALLVDKSLDKRNKEASLKKAAEEKAISDKLISDLNTSISLTKDFKSNSESLLGDLGTNVNQQKSNLLGQASLLDKTSTLISHPFFPFTLQVAITLKTKFKSVSKQTEWNELIKIIVKNKTQFSLPNDFTFYSVNSDSVTNNITFGANTPLDPSKFNTGETKYNNYDKHFNKLLELIYWNFLPTLTFSVVKDTSNYYYGKEWPWALYRFTCGKLLDPNSNMLGLVTNGSNCKISCNIDCETNELTIVYNAPSTTFFSESSFTSLFEQKEGNLSIVLESNDDVNLENVILLCGNKPERIEYINFRLLPAKSNSDGQIKSYSTSIADALNHMPK